MPERAYLTPGTVAEALESARRSAGNCIFSAGGTDLHLLRQQKLVTKPVIIDLCGIPEMRGVRASGVRASGVRASGIRASGIRASGVRASGIQEAGGSLEIGSLTTLDELIASSLVRDWSPLVAEAAASVATPVLRHTATLGGNLLVANRCAFYNQSEAWRESVGSCLRDKGDTCLATGGHDKCFSRNVSDLAPALIALGATAMVQDAATTRELPLEGLYNADGIRFHTDLGLHWILTAIRLTAPPERAWFRKLRQRASLDFSSLTVSAVRFADGRYRVCIGSVSMSPVLLELDPSASSLDDWKSQARRLCKTVDNDLMPLKYRRAMLEVFLEEALVALGGSGPSHD